MKVVIPLAEGFEEIEAVTVIDLLRRASINTVTVAAGLNPVKGSHSISITADRILNDNDEFNAIVLPGGAIGSMNLKKDPDVIKLVKKIYHSGGLVAAICAAPIILAESGILQNKKYTCYPGYETQITGGIYHSEPVVRDERIITAKGAACAIPFALKIIEVIKGEKIAKEIRDRIMTFW